MSEFQIGLLIAGALAIGAVLVYNALQEHNARRQADRAFGSRHPDALMQGEPASHEARRGPAGPAPPASQPDPAVDYIVELALRAPADSQSVVAQLESVERRFGRRAAFHVSGSRVSAALQLASRDGPVSEADLIEFRASLENVAAQSGAKIAAPEMKHAVEGARELVEAHALFG